MASQEEIIIAHYSATREEKLERMRARDKYVIWYIAASAIIGSYASTSSEHWNLTFLIPFLSFISAAIYAYNELTIGALTRWLNTEYSECLEKYCSRNDVPYSLAHWDNSREQKEFSSTSAFRSRHYVVSATFLGTAILAVLFAYEFSGLTPREFINGNWVVSALGILLAIFGSSGILVASFRRSRETNV